MQVTLTMKDLVPLINSYVEEMGLSLSDKEVEYMIKSGRNNVMDSTITVDIFNKPDTKNSDDMNHQEDVVTKQLNKVLEDTPELDDLIEEDEPKKEEESPKPKLWG